jgi:hypothetical protein
LKSKCWKNLAVQNLEPHNFYLFSYTLKPQKQQKWTTKFKQNKNRENEKEILYLGFLTNQTENTDILQHCF